MKIDWKLDKKFQIGLDWKTESFLEHFPNRYFGPVVVLTLQKHRVHIFAENMLQMAVTIMDQVWGNHLGKSSFLNSYEVVIQDFRLTFSNSFKIVSR